jgi:hypothetical protein
MKDTKFNNEGSGSDQSDMSKKIQVTKQTNEQMRKRNWVFAGTTTDETILTEIKRDYLENGARDVAFTKGINTIKYWIRYE